MMISKYPYVAPQWQFALRFGAAKTGIAIFVAQTKKYSPTVLGP
jgi:hypothetical protein